MTPAEKHQANTGRTGALPDALRDALTGAGGSAPVKPHRPHRTGRAVPQVNNRPLSRDQKATLSVLAAEAFAIQSRHGLVEEGTKVDAWRRAESIAAAGVRISEAKQAHYRPLLGHFQALAGKQTADTLANITAAEDDPDRQAVMQHLRNAVAGFAETPDKIGEKTGWHRAESYLLTIANNQRSGVRVNTLAQLAETWPVAKLWSLVYTMRNRTAAKDGRGYSADRNKSQRRP